jgi:hypothetical protein
MDNAMALAKEITLAKLLAKWLAKWLETWLVRLSAQSMDIELARETEIAMAHLSATLWATQLETPLAQSLAIRWATQSAKS